MKQYRVIFGKVKVYGIFNGIRFSMETFSWYDSSYKTVNNSYMNSMPLNNVDKIL